MTDIELRNRLQGRLSDVRARAAEACSRAGRHGATVRIVAVTKSVSPRVVACYREIGLTEFGESRPQELWRKAAAVPDATWHLIGHLQRNKLERTVPLVALVHSADGERILEALDSFGRKRGIPVPVLLEVNCSREGAKGGFRPEDVPALGAALPSRVGLRVEGLMTMAPRSDDPQACRPTFAELRTLAEALRANTGLTLPELSMGMSDDYGVAIEEGATIVRIGTALCGGLDDE